MLAPPLQALLEKLNESLNRAGTRLAAVTLLGHLIRKQPPWVHHISQSALLSSLLRCLKVQTHLQPCTGANKQADTLEGLRSENVSLVTEHLQCNETKVTEDLKQTLKFVFESV